MFSSFDEAAGRDERPFNRNKAASSKLNQPTLNIQRAWPCPSDLERVLSTISDAKKPVLIGGHGVWWSGAEQLLEKVGSALCIPVFNVPYHQKLIGEHIEAYMGLADVHQYQPSGQALKESDVVVLIGGRLDNQMNFGNPPFFPHSTTLICVNGSHEEIDLNRAADDLLLSDPGAFLQSLLELKASDNWKLDRGWYDDNIERRGHWVNETIEAIPGDDVLQGAIHPLQVALDVQDAMSDDDWLVIDGGNTHFWSEIAVNIAGWKGKKLGNILHPGTFSMLGVGVSFAIAAKLTHSTSNVVLVSGDGAFLSGGLSVEAAFQENLPIVVVIDNNGGLDCISQQQERLFTSETHFATDFRDIPFHTMFEGLGGYGELVESREDIIPAVKRAIASGKTACVNVKTKGHISPIVLATTSKRDKASIE